MVEAAFDNHESDQSNHLPVLKIFLASPCDVLAERMHVHNSIALVAAEPQFASSLKLELVAWDNPDASVALEASITPQQAIAQGLPLPEQCDLVVVIFWSRMGTPIDQTFASKSDGQAYFSGTEWEYHNALQSRNQPHTPKIWVYRRSEAFYLTFKDPDYKKKEQQWQHVEAFFKDFNNADGTAKRGYNEYATPEEFREKFTANLRNWLQQKLNELSTPPADFDTAKNPPAWQGSPFPGLLAFSPEQERVFFGRGKETDDLFQRFSQCKLVAVVGASGAGKSSLVQAGLLPRLRAGVAGKVFTDITIKPSARGDNPFLALAAALQERLGKHGETEQDLANRLRSEPDLIREKLLALTPTRLSHCLLIIDQYEEVFAATVSTSMRQDFAQKLAHCIEHARLHVLLSVREDFYSDLFSQQPLTASLQQGGTFPLPAPDRMQLRQMFSKPAQLAGLQLDDGLIDTVLDATGTGSAALALAAYTFYLLYEQGQGLTLAGYQAIGGVDGAIRKRVALAMTGIDTDLLQQLFAHIVEVKISEQAASQTIIRVRRRALKTYLPVAVQTLAQKLADARLLVISGEQESQKTVEIAHESVLTVWEALNQWLNKQEQALRNRSLLEQTALVWLNANKNRQHLHSGKTLKALQTAMRPISPTAVAYLAACRSKQRLIVSGLALLGLVLLLSLIPLKFIHDSNYESPMAFKGWLTRMNLLPVPIPDMVSIPARQFMMGSVDGVGEADEHPRHLVTLAAFDLGKYELSFAEYDLFAAATGRAKPGDYSFGNDRPTMPAINISWQDAIAYCQWLSEKTGQRFRLPTEAEWEYAARAGTDSDYYWGNAVQAGQTESACDYTNVYDLDAGKKYTTGEHFACHDGYTDFAPVKAVFKGQHPWQLNQILGNVWEWTQDCYEDNYQHATTDDRARGLSDANECAKRSLRGGAWGSGPVLLRSANRGRNSAGVAFLSVGFRLARTD